MFQEIFYGAIFCLQENTSAHARSKNTQQGFDNTTSCSEVHNPKV